jgi:hypothetical protein
VCYYLYHRWVKNNSAQVQVNNRSQAVGQSINQGLACNEPDAQIQHTSASVLHFIISSRWMFKGMTGYDNLTPGISERQFCGLLTKNFKDIEPLYPQRPGHRLNWSSFPKVTEWFAYTPCNIIRPLNKQKTLLETLTLHR